MKNHMKVLDMSEKKKLTIGAVTSQSTKDNKTGSWRTFTPVVDVEKCKGCGICVKACPEAGMGMHEKEGKVVANINYEYCKGCMLCATVCPLGAIKNKEGKK